MGIKIKDRSKSAPLVLLGKVLFWTLATMAAANLAVARTPWWFFQPWTGPLASQNVKLACAFKSRSAGEVALIGDSRVRHGLVPAAMGEVLEARVVNLALDAAQLVAMAEIVDRVMEMDERPRMVVLGVSAFTVNVHNPRLARDLRLYARPAAAARGLVVFPDLDQKAGAIHALTHGLENIIQFPALSAMPPACALVEAGGGGAYLYPLTEAVRAHNLRAVPHRELEARERAFARALPEYLDEHMREFEIGRCKILFEAILARIESGGARPVVALMPESERFVEAAPHPGREEARDFFRSAAHAHGALFIDLNAPGLRPADEDFFDYSAHLSPEPAILLSRELAKMIAGELGR